MPRALHAPRPSTTSLLRRPAPRRRTASLTIAAALALAVVPAAGPAVAAEVPGPVVSVAGSEPALTAGRGAQVPFVEHEAEHGTTNGTVLARSDVAHTLAGEASGRRAVQLTAGQHLDLTLSAPASAVVVRASVPDGTDGRLEVSAPGMTTASLAVTSRYSWFYGAYPFTNTASDGGARHLYDESRVLLGTTLPAGTVVRFTLAAGSPTTTVDLADFEDVGSPLPRPAGSLSVLDYGADPSGAKDSTDAFDAALAAARGQDKTVWIPAGTFTVTRHLWVDRLTLAGAGPWFSVLRGAGVGIFGSGAPAGSHDVVLRDFAVLGEVTVRDDSAPTQAIGGALHDSEVVNVWMQHTKVGMWLTGPFDNFHARDLRILDTAADGVNFHDGVTNSSVTNSFVRNTGDDGLAMWAETNQEVGNTFSRNTVVLPVLANSIAIYGGQDVTVSGNVVADTQDSGGGIHVGNRFGARSAAGTFTIADNTTLRAGNLDPNWKFGTGALWFQGLDSPLTADIRVTGLHAYDSPYEAVQAVNTVQDLVLEDVEIRGTGTFAVQLHASGSASFRNVRATQVGGPGGTYRCSDAASFAVQDLGGNSGWTSVYCGAWPAPVTPPFDSTVVAATAVTAPGGDAAPTPTPTTTAAPAATGPVTGLADKCLDVADAATANGTAVQLYTCNGTRAQDWTVRTDGTLRALGKCLDVDGARTAPGTRVQLWECNGSVAQTWTATSAHELRNPNSGLCLDVSGWGTADRTRVIVWTCHGGANQRWVLPAA